MNRNINNWIMYVVLLVLTLQIANALTVDELLSTYDYDYSVEGLTVNDYSTSEVDINQNQLTDLIIVTTNITVEAGTYDFIGELYYQDEVVQTVNFSYDLVQGEINIYFNFTAKSLSEYDYNFSLQIYQDDLLVLREDKKHLVTFNYSKIEPKDIELLNFTTYLIDNTSDTRADYFALNLTLNSSIDENITTIAYIYDQDQNLMFITQEGRSSQNQTLLFPSELVRDNKLHGNFTLTSVVIETSDITYNYDVNGSLGEYIRTQFDPKKTVFSQEFSEDILLNYHIF